ncbi:MAG: flagellar protein FlaG [Desulfobacterales bacterium]|nr:flagellar protein FlaG [Desulfobacterales bacterium]
MDVSNTNMDVSHIVPPQTPEQTGNQPPAVDPSDKPVKPAQISRNDVDEMVEALQDLAETLNTSMNFSVNENTNDIVVQIIDKETKEVIRQIPPEELLEIQEKMMDLTGFLLNKEV